MDRKIIPVIMAGGRGTRLWPLSRSASPKQFIRFIGEHTLFQSTLLRVSDRSIYEPPIVVTNDDFRFLVAEQARELGLELSTIILEPVPRNTAAAVAAATLVVSQRYGEDSVVQILASDHDIAIEAQYFEANAAARAAAVAGRIVTFGITPSEPATGYGYIEVGEALPCGVHAVRRFIEKPPLESAIEMIATGRFYWNSGMFMFLASAMLAEMTEYAEEVLKVVRQAVSEAAGDLDFLRLGRESFTRSPDISIDYAVMERTSRAAVVPSHFKWSDLGSWDAVWKNGLSDTNENVASENTTLLNTKRSLVMTRGAHLVVNGLEDVVAIASEDAVYVGRLEDSQDVGKVVKHLASVPATSGLTQVHPTAYRPWGGYTSILSGDRFHVKRIFVLPGKMLSLQKHHHRAEHWIVVKGTAEVTVGQEVQLLRENESVYIPLGEVHRLSNPGKIMLELIEVQTGSYLAEDDIIRIADEFGRS
ncbi:mannose-1-phosphate guanylyltransferase/mannose-6-phosphate isomerase [Ensifer aridi]|uniref:mannose-1-phosphate guanylyltransferase/mannose-6-phosphate isomerase n=1 Tax=Ensifer aridi TaxID=1708715 RepID=UPI00111BEF68|nr:mannose-1-phosphate guanylyltransferase/mannose-6-phosphate isomerase [Ensifer aridi]